MRLSKCPKVAPQVYDGTELELESQSTSYSLELNKPSENQWYKSTIERVRISGFSSKLNLFSQVI